MTSQNLALTTPRLISKPLSCPPCRHVLILVTPIQSRQPADANLN
jgi:hypothetical protein